MGETHDKIARAACEIRRLHAEFKNAFKTLGRSGCGPQRRAFLDSLGLPFPPHLQQSLEPLKLGEPRSVEFALCYLESRPYYFRSQYLFKTMLRSVKRARLDSDQRRRLDVVLAGIARSEELEIAWTGSLQLLTSDYGPSTRAVSAQSRLLLAVCLGRCGLFT